MRDGSAKIPDNLDTSDSIQVVMCIPNDDEWIATLRGVVFALTRGRTWQRDHRENSIRQAQAIGYAIYDSLMICNLQQSLESIASAIDRLANSASPCCGDTIPPTTPTVTPIDENNPTIPPHVPNEGENDALCHLLNLVYGAMLYYLDKLQEIALGSYGVALIASLLAIVFPEPITTAVGTIVFATIASAMFGWGTASTAIAGTIAQVIEEIEEEYNTVFCSLPKTNYILSATQWADYIASKVAGKLVENGAPQWVADRIAHLFQMEQWVKSLYKEWYENGEWADMYPDNPLVCECVPAVGVFVPLTVDDNYQPNPFWTIYNHESNTSTYLINNGVAVTKTFTGTPWLMTDDGIMCRYGGVVSGVFTVDTPKRWQVTAWRPSAGYYLSLSVFDELGNTLHNQTFAPGTSKWWTISASYILQPATPYIVRVSSNSAQDWVVKDLALIDAV